MLIEEKEALCVYVYMCVCAVRWKFIASMTIFMPKNTTWEGDAENIRQLSKTFLEINTLKFLRQKVSSFFRYILICIIGTFWVISITISYLHE